MLMRRTALRLLALAGLLATYYALDWYALRRLLRDACRPPLRRLGHAVAARPEYRDASGSDAARAAPDHVDARPSRYAALMDRLSHADDGRVALRVDRRIHSISADCTYIDLALVLIPFLWRAGRTTRRNIAVILLAGMAVLTVNYLRIVAAMHADARGAAWFLAHDLPDMLLYWPAVFVAAFAACRADGRAPLAHPPPE